MLSFGTGGAIVPRVVSIRETFCFTVTGTDVESDPDCTGTNDALIPKA